MNMYSLDDVGLGAWEWVCLSFITQCLLRVKSFLLNRHAHQYPRLGHEVIVVVVVVAAAAVVVV